MFFESYPTYTLTKIDYSDNQTGVSYECTVIGTQVHSACCMILLESESYRHLPSPKEQRKFFILIQEGKLLEALLFWEGNIGELTSLCKFDIRVITPSLTISPNILEEKVTNLLSELGEPAAILLDSTNTNTELTTTEPLTN